MSLATHRQGHWDGPDDKRDPVQVMIDVVNGFETFIDKAKTAENRGLTYRNNLLWVHAVAALTMAPLFVITGRSGMQYNPNFRFLLMVPGAPMTIGLVLGWGGLILGLGCVLRVRLFEIIGLIGLALFYLTMAISFGTSGIAYYLNGDTGPRPTIYSPILYIHMTIIMAVHMATLVRSQWKSRLTDVVR